MLRALLLLLVGVLVGANVVYFVMSLWDRDGDAAHAAMVEAKPRMDAAPKAVPAPDAPSPVQRVPVEVSVPPVEAGASGSAPDAASAAARARSRTPAVNPSGLIIPVSGVATNALVDTYADARNQGRSHDAIDIMAPAGTPVLAVADGHVEKLFTSDRGGLTIYQFEPSGRYAYYYAHLQSYAPGLHEKQRIRQGEVIGYVGSTGNASPEAPHLHFAIFALGPEKQWWKGTAINPYPLLGGNAP